MLTSTRSDKLKIAMLGHKRIPSREGGIEIVVEKLATGMARLGHSVTVYNRRGHHVSGAEYDNINDTDSPTDQDTDDGQDRYKGVRIKRVWTIDARGLAAVSSSVFASIAAAFGPYDVVHVHAEGPCLMCGFIKFMGKRVIVTVHGLDHKREKWGRFASWYIMQGEQAAVKHADEIIVLSKAVQDYFMELYGRRTIYIPNGVDAVKPLEADIITDKWGLKKDGYILFLGRIVPEKGAHYLIEAYRGLSTDKKLVIAGGASDSDEYYGKLKETAGDDNNIIFTGFVQGAELEELYSNAYIYCLPSDLEGMPLSLLEAMSYGNACLTSDIPECADVIEDNGVIFKKGDIMDLRAKIDDLLNDRFAVDALKAQSAAYITAKYSWDDSIRKTLELYRERTS